MKHLNIEIKSKQKDIDSIRNILVQHNAEFKCIDNQIDTYYIVNSGRLKLREGNIENSLIYYQRKDQQGPKQSDVVLYRTEPNSSLKEVLEKSLNILVKVKKQREIYFIENVKFHLDNVDKLGYFIEIEAINTDQYNSKDKLLKQCEYYIELFNIDQNDLISESYSDMLLKKYAD